MFYVIFCKEISPLLVSPMALQPFDQIQRKLPRQKFIKRRSLEYRNNRITNYWSRFTCQLVWRIFRLNRNIAFLLVCIDTDSDSYQIFIVETIKREHNFSRNKKTLEPRDGRYRDYLRHLIH